MNEDKATRYQRLKRQASVVSVVWSLSLLAVIVVTGWSAALRDVAAAWAQRGPERLREVSAVLLFVAFLSLLHEAAGFPLAVYSGFLLERRYELSNESFRRWLGDQAKSFAVGLGLGVVAAELVYGSIRAWPAAWWLVSGLVFIGLIVVLTNLAPILLLPLFYPVKPLDRDALTARLLALADRAGARVLGAYEWGLG